MSAALKPLPYPMTVDAFLEWDAPGPGRWQLVDGVAVAMAPTTDRHGLIQAELTRLISNHLVESGRDCRVIVAPGVVPRVQAATNFRIPDIGVTCAPVSDAAVASDPVVLIEILSPSNEAQTRVNIWAYCTIPSVREIVLVSSERVEVEVFRRGADRDWPQFPIVARAGGGLVFESIGFEVGVDAVYRTAGLD